MSTLHRRRLLVLLRGGGDLASGAAYRLFRAGLPVLITELPQPLVVRRLVAFAEAVYRGVHQVEGITARCVDSLEAALAAVVRREIPVLVDPEARVLPRLRERAEVILVDGRMTKRPPDLGMAAAPLVIGLGPGFVAGEHCHAVVETNRGHFLGRVYWRGSAQPDTGIPEAVLKHQADRVLRAPCDGVLEERTALGAHVKRGQVVALVGDQAVCAPFDGVLRGLVHGGLRVTRGVKIGDVDPRDDPRYARLISDKALAVGGGVLEAVLTRYPVAR